MERAKKNQSEEYKNDAGVDYRATDITRRDKSGKGFAGDDRTNLREDYKRKFGDTDGPAKYYVDYSDKCDDGSDYCAIDRNKEQKKSKKR